MHAGAHKARERSRDLIEKLRWAVGIRTLTDRVIQKSGGVSAGAQHAARASAANAALPQLKSYRERDGKFYFKLSAADGAVLLQSRGFDSPKDAGRLVAALVEGGEDANASRALIAESTDDSSAQFDAIVAALTVLKADKLAKERAKAG